MSLITPPQKLGFTPNQRKSLYSWGDGNFYGVGRATNGLSALEIDSVGNRNWYHVGAGICGLGITCDGKMYGWGRRLEGQMGNGTSPSQYSLPVRIGTDTNWKWATTTFGSSHAIKKDGTLWATGNNAYGRLGLGDNTARTSWTQVGALDDWDKVYAHWDTYHTIAKKQNGTIWAWGKNNFGQLGQNTTTNSYSPLQIGSSGNWKSIALGQDFTVGVRDNKIYGCGRGRFNRFGGGDNYSSMTQVFNPGGNTIQKVVAGRFHSIALCNNKLYSTGYNPNYALGIGGFNNGSLDGFTDIAPYGYGNVYYYSDVATNYAATMVIIKDGSTHGELRLRGRAYSIFATRYYRGILGDGNLSSIATSYNSTTPNMTKCEKVIFGRNVGFVIKKKN